MAKTPTQKQKLAALADEAVSKWANKGGSREWQDLRDRLDLSTGGELDYHPLNILTDMVEKRLAQIEGRQ